MAKIMAQQIKSQTAMARSPAGVSGVAWEDGAAVAGKVMRPLSPNYETRESPV
jgi:hypothetical protein